jgi:hypothetical protein
MRIFLIFCLLISLSAGAQTVLRQPVSLSATDKTAGGLLQELNRQPGVRLNYSSGIIDLLQPVVLSGTEKTVEDYLRVILKGQPVRYVEKDGKIYLVPAGAPKRRVTLSGYITDSQTGERLIGASLFLPHLRQGTTSNTYGFYSITVWQDSLQLQASYTGYQPQALNVDLSQDVVLNIALEQAPALSELVVVNTEERRDARARTVIGKTDVSQALVKSVPALLGEADVLKALQLLPGVGAGTEGTSGLHIRGGGADENLVLLDGVPVYNAAHAFGLFSIFNADAVQRAELMKSAFPASHGGRTSSIIEVHMKEGNKYKFQGEGGIGLIFSKLTLEGPIKKGRSSFMVSGRRTYADLLLRPLIRAAGDADIQPFFKDLNAKANFPVGKKDRIYFSVYTGTDKLTALEKYAVDQNSVVTHNDYENGFSWGNVTAITRWNHELNAKTFANFTVNYSRYHFSVYQDDKKTSGGTQFLHEKQRYFSGVDDISIKGDIDYLPNPRHFVKTGFAVTRHYYRPGEHSFYFKDTAAIIDERITQHSQYTTEYDAYLEDDIEVSERLKVNVGLRLSALSGSGKLFFFPQPRFSGLYKLSDRWKLKGAGSVMNQFIHLLTNSSLGLPTDLWVPATAKVPPQWATQVSAGVAYTPGSSLEASAELYYKRVNNVIEYAEGSSFSTAWTGWEEAVERGRGTAYGAEWMLHKKKGVVTGIVSYTLGRSLRHFANINEGRTFPYKYDRRHDFKVAAVWKISPRVECSLGWFYSTGHAVSLPVGYYYNPYNQRYMDIYEGRNNYRMPDYHRLDASIRMIRQKKKHLRSWTFGIYNAYGRYNPVFLYRDSYPYPGGKVQFRQAALFPFIPSVTYQFKF